MSISIKSGDRSDGRVVTEIHCRTDADAQRVIAGFNALATEMYERGDMESVRLWRDAADDLEMVAGTVSNR
ncbi:hypothetical protein EG850_11165 [Gulosibacter macacae]|uniref:Uncharacterized protein n=1 Tax=Gulosibacter macacae TaxID=2488791 RepID=A0A3P3VVC6_9MICO|nr:hypothetical protein [Gulosibacter macacae]RRJ85938.1 hypothetical protein EG850_11165 [Gulosibacter macacae]